MLEIMNHPDFVPLTGAVVAQLAKARAAVQIRRNAAEGKIFWGLTHQDYTRYRSRLEGTEFQIYLSPQVRIVSETVLTSTPIDHTFLPGNIQPMTGWLRYNESRTFKLEAPQRVSNGSEDFSMVHISFLDGSAIISQRTEDLDRVRNFFRSILALYPENIRREVLEIL
jgi:hypothetical protein